MFSQVSRIPDLIQKMCGLYAGVYGTLFHVSLLQHSKKIFVWLVIFKLLMYLMIKLNHIDSIDGNA